ncbi:ABC transporter ATP-binding protein [Curtobacterium pusillum]|uniref:dipeptide ABC transporter ATP-binding protein n=1 Tax=Curtobacterium pusillum TaxID=69373 RepID=UPI0011A406E8|nr:ABC transporter ATP-binding protein [Curtobacterium pusillum]
MTALDAPTIDRPDDVLIDVVGLDVSFDTPDGGRKHIVKDVGFTLRRGQCVALVGESGSGKSVTARSIVGLAGEGSRVSATTLALEGESLLGRPESWWRRVRGRRVGFVLQDALVSLDPLRPVGKEIEEAYQLHGVGDRASRRAAAIEVLDRVGVPEPDVRARQRAGELSGGLRQRALIASAIALDPQVIIADEPTTALDVTVQAQILGVLEGMIAEGRSVVLISHDLAVVARLADEVLVMQDGRIVESGTTDQILDDPQHPYTRQLIDAVPSEHTKGTRLAPEDPSRRSASELFPPRASLEREAERGHLLEVRDVVKSYRGPDRVSRRAVDGVSFHLDRGETLGIVGESGSGKSTVARIALSLVRPDSGDVLFGGAPWTTASQSAQRAVRRGISVVYQDPLSSFDPRWRVGRILEDAVRLGDPGRANRSRERVVELLEMVGLAEASIDVWPRTLSGGQRQRVAIARALATNPEVVVLDEAVSALDVSIQAQILDLLQDLQAQLGVSYLFISHDLGVIHHMSDRVVVMQHGRAVEQGTADDVFTRPKDPYTRQLLESLPRLQYARLHQAARRP